MISLSVLILAIIRSTIPILLVSVGGNYSARTGTMALGMEGFLLIGAFSAALGSYFTGVAALGLLIGVISTMLYSLLFGVLVIKFKVNQVLSGVGLNMLASGLTASLTQIVWGNRGYSVSVETLSKCTVPGVGEVSYIIFFGFAITILAWVFMFRTTWGLRLRMVGENPLAALTQGIKVKKYRYLGILFCGLLCGIAGAYLSIDHVNRFVREMSAGRGYIAVAVNILGGFNPLGSLWASMLFGTVDALSTIVFADVASAQLMQMLPYIITIIVVVISGKRVNAPAGMNMME